MEMAREMIANNECRSIKGLAVKGTDLMALGLEGEEIGTILEEILQLVMEERLINEKRALMKYIRQRCSR